MSGLGPPIIPPSALLLLPLYILHSNFFASSIPHVLGGLGPINGILHGLQAVAFSSFPL